MDFIDVQGYTLKSGHAHKFQEWLAANEKEIRNLAPPGTEYIGTYAVTHTTEETTMPDDVREIPARNDDSLSRFLGGSPLAVALRRVLDELTAEDRLILRMRFADGLTVRAIAGALDLEPRRMYGRVQRLLVDVRRRIEACGVACDEVLDLLDEPGSDLEAGLREAPSKDG